MLTSCQNSFATRFCSKFVVVIIKIPTTSKMCCYITLSRDSRQLTTNLSYSFWYHTVECTPTAHITVELERICVFEKLILLT